MNTMQFTDFETVYESVAQAIDRAGTDKREIFLAKLVLLLSQEIGDSARVLRAIEDCLKDL